MNYLSIYKSIIRKAKREHEIRLFNQKNKLEYYEEHHVVPKSIMLVRKPRLKIKSRSSSNLMNRSWNTVLLTAKEHFIIHLLLVKICKIIYGDNHLYTFKMVHATMRFIYDKQGKRMINRKITSNEYATLKKEISRVSSIINKKRLKDKTKHPNYGKIGKLNPLYNRESPLKGRTQPGLLAEKNGMFGKCGVLNPFFNKTHSSESILKMKTNQRHDEESQNVNKRGTYTATRRNGSTIDFIGMAKFCRENPEYSQSSLSQVLHGHRPFHKDIIKVELTPHS